MELMTRITVGLDDSSPHHLLRAPEPWVTEPYGELQPEKRLMIAVLEESLREATQREIAGSYRRHRRIREAQAWFAATDHDWPFSFVSICDFLDLDASHLRRQLAQLQAARLPKLPQIVTDDDRRPINQEGQMAHPRVSIP